VRGIDICIFIWITCSFAIFKAAGMPAIGFTREIQGFILFCGDKSLPKKYMQITFSER
jgi:hypothetical protein